MPENRESRTPGDGELLYRLSRGDEPAYRLLHDRHQSPVFRTSLVLMHTTRDAEEVAATAFFELWRRRDKVRLVDGAVLPWLLATAASAAKNSRRSGRRYRRFLRRIPRGDVSGHADHLTQAMESVDISVGVREELLGLNRRDTMIAVLCVIHGLSVADAAVVLGISEGTVASRVERVKNRLGRASYGHAPAAREATA